MLAQTESCISVSVPLRTLNLGAAYISDTEEMNCWELNTLHWQQYYLETSVDNLSSRALSMVQLEALTHLRLSDHPEFL